MSENEDWTRRQAERQECVRSLTPPPSVRQIYLSCSNRELVDPLVAREGARLSPRDSNELTIKWGVDTLKPNKN
jgi:hypothetical protein